MNVEKSIEDMSLEETIAYISDYYGIMKQAIKLGEEMGELFRAVSGYIDGRNGKESVEEEIADVLIMMWQIERLIDTNGENVSTLIADKLERQMLRIKKEKGL